MAGAVSDTKEVVIDGIKFFLTPLDGWLTYELEPDVIRLMAPALEVMGAIGNLDTADTSQLTKGANAYAAAMTPSDRKTFMQKLIAGSAVQHNGENQDLSAVFATLFQGRPLTRWKLTLEIVKVSWPDFFGLFAANATAAAKKARPSAESTT